MQGKSKWFFHLCGCYRKGYEASAAGKTEADCPYVGSGVSRQRRIYWLRGHQKHAAGEPLQ